MREREKGVNGRGKKMMCERKRDSWKEKYGTRKEKEIRKEIGKINSK